MKHTVDIRPWLFNTNYRLPRKTLAGLLTILVLLVLPANAQEQQNVLFIAIDDLKTIGSIYSEEGSDFLRHIYPDDSLRRQVVTRMTPNLQRLADQSVTFMNAYTASPACNPSRAALMTGIRPHRTGLVQNEGGLFFRTWEYGGKRPLAEATTIPEQLKANGWYAAETGKIFHGQGDLDRADGYRSWSDWTHVNEGAGDITISTYSPASLKWGIRGDLTTTVDKQNDNQAADFIARLLENGQVINDTTTFEIPPDKPFFLACGIFKPHLPFATTQDMLNLFPVEEMTLTRELLQYFIDDASDLPPVGLRYSGCTIDGASGDPVLNKDRFIDVLEHGLTIDTVDGDMDGWKDMLMHYFACVATADRAVGRLLDGLENSLYANNTMVILWSDHGYHLGEKIHVSKFTLWDDGSRVYFIIKDPRNPQSAGKHCFQPVSLMDIYPTVVQMAGLEIPDERITGRNLFPLLEDPDHDWAAPAHTTFRTPDSHLIRDDRFKLIRYEGNNSEVELYDMQTDGEEYFNLAGDPGYEQVLTKMKRLMEVAIIEGNFENLYDSTVSDISINNCPDSMYTGSKHQLTAIVEPSYAKDTLISWRSSDTSVAWVDVYGLVTTVSAGNATISAITNDGGYMDECNFSVLDPSATSSASKLELPENDVKLYPNPVDHALYCKFPDAELQKKVTIFNLHGHCLARADTFDDHLEINVEKFKMQSFLIVEITHGENKLFFKVIAN